MPAGERAAAAVERSDAVRDGMPVEATGDLIDVPLIAVAHARSGDKGDSSNIAIFCRRPEFVDHLRTILTPDAIAAQFAGTVEGPVVRYEAPGLSAFNFVLDRALGGGGMASMRIDFQGKAYGQRALEMIVPVPASWPLKSPAPSSDVSSTTSVRTSASEARPITRT